MSTPPRLWLALVLLALLLRLPALLHPRAIDDEETYSVVATEMVHGGLPYVSAVERKPPLLFWIYAAVFRLAGPYNWLALHFAATLWLLLSMVGLFLLGRRLFGPAGGLVAALLYLIFLGWGTWKNLAWNGEMLMNLPIIWAYLIGFGRGRGRVRPELLAAGALLAAAFLLKQPAAIAAIPLGLYLLLPAYRRTRGLGLGHSLLHGALLTAGFAVALGAVALVLDRQGVLREAFYWTILDHDVPHIFWAKGFGFTAAFLVACAPVVLASLPGMTRAVDPRGLIWSGHSAERQALVGLLGASAVGAAASGRFYPHYYLQLLPPLVLLAAPVLAALWSGGAGPRTPGWFGPRATRVWVGLSALVFLVIHADGLRHQPDSAAGRWVRDHAGPQDRLFVWGQAIGMYLDARLRPASRYVATFPLTGYIFGGEVPGADTRNRILPGSWQILQRELAEHPARYIIDAEGVRARPRHPVADFPALAGLLAADYQEVERTADGIIYRRRAGLSSASR